jgi:hypothetical protein
VYTDTVACIYNVDEKCKGTLTLEHLNILQKAFNRNKCSGLHDHVQPPPISFASELVSLIARKDTSASKYTKKHPRDKVLGANTSAFSSRFFGFSICHLIYHENIMLLTTRHTIYSAAVSTEETSILCSSLPGIKK